MRSMRSCLQSNIKKGGAVSSILDICHRSHYGFLWLLCYCEKLPYTEQARNFEIEENSYDTCISLHILIITS